MDYGRYDPAIDPAYFTNTPIDSFWSSSPYAFGSKLAWDLYFDSGYAGYNHRYYALRVRLVRGGQPEYFTYPLMVSVTGTGTVTSNPAGIHCSSVGSCVSSTSFVGDTPVTLTATPVSGQAFKSWSGCTPVTGNPKPCKVTVTASKSVSAAFGL